MEAAPWWERDASTTGLCRSGRNPAKTVVFGTMLIEGKKGLKCPGKISTATMMGPDVNPIRSFMPRCRPARVLPEAGSSREET